MYNPPRTSNKVNRVAEIFQYNRLEKTGGEGVPERYAHAVGNKQDFHFVFRPAAGLAAVRHAEGVGTGFGDLGEKFGGGEVVGAGPLVGDVGAGGGGGRKVALNFEADGK